jgi:hypothetical protein
MTNTSDSTDKAGDCIFSSMRFQDVAEIDSLSAALKCAQTGKCPQSVSCSDMALDHIYKIVDLAKENGKQ